MTAKTTKKSPFSPRRTFDAAVDAAALLLESGKMTTFIEPDGGLECQVSEPDIEEACGDRLSVEEFRKVFDTELRAAMVLLVAEVPQERWHRIVPVPDDEGVSDAQKKEWERRVTAVSERISLDELRPHFAHKTQGLLPLLVELEGDYISSHESDPATPVARKALVRLTAETPVRSQDAEVVGAVPSALRALLTGAVLKRDSLVLLCDVKDVEYLLRQLTEVRDELIKD